MGKCLVTKLQESVSDSTLLRLGERAFTLLAGASITMTGVGVKLRTIGGGTIDVTSSAGDVPDEIAVTEYQIKGGYTFVKNSGDANLLIGISNIEKLTAFSTEFPNPLSLEVDLSIFNLYPEDLVEVNLSNQRITGGTLADMAMISKQGRAIVSLNFGNAIGVKGSLNDLQELLMGTDVLPVLTNCAEVTGEILDYVKAQRTLGKVSASHAESAWITGTAVTFNGVQVPAVDWTTLSWTESTITFNGTTINA
jgi:hypothetical protein